MQSLVFSLNLLLALPDKGRSRFQIIDPTQIKWWDFLFARGIKCYLADPKT
jgi:hypothetical protein